MIDLLQRVLLGVMVLGAGCVLMSGVGVWAWCREVFKATAPDVPLPAAEPAWGKALALGGLLAVVLLIVAVRA